MASGLNFSIFTTKPILTAKVDIRVLLVEFSHTDKKKLLDVMYKAGCEQPVLRIVSQNSSLQMYWQGLDSNSNIDVEWKMLIEDVNKFKLSQPHMTVSADIEQVEDSFWVHHGLCLSFCSSQDPRSSADLRPNCLPRLSYMMFDPDACTYDAHIYDPQSLTLMHV